MKVCVSLLYPLGRAGGIPIGTLDADLNWAGNRACFRPMVRGSSGSHAKLLLGIGSCIGAASAKGGSLFQVTGGRISVLNGRGDDPHRWSKAGSSEHQEPSGTDIVEPMLLPGGESEAVLASRSISLEWESGFPLCAWFLRLPHCRRPYSLFHGSGQTVDSHRESPLSQRLLRNG
jgi:hypothetical protein